VLHALELAGEDLERWCGGLSDDQVNESPAGIAPVAFHIRHIARSMDRLLTYAEGRPLSTEQIAKMKTEIEARSTRSELFAELSTALAESGVRVRVFGRDRMNEPRRVGRKELLTTVGGLLVHVADHTQPHVGQAITTSKLILARGGSR
jgi:hypothetical protein